MTTGWRDGALCAQIPVDFFPEKGSTGAVKLAKQVCALCDDDIREACLEYALSHGERYGVWGGKAERERRTIARRRRQQLRDTA